MTESTKIFVDSSVIVEYLKENERAVNLMDTILNRTDLEVYINDIVYSEVAYVYIRTKSGKSHLTLKKSKSLVSIIGKEFLSSAYPLLDVPNFLVVNKDVISIANDFIEKYGLLPNDALILATCKYYKIGYLAILDVEDFKKPCEEERIVLISDSGDLS